MTHFQNDQNGTWNHQAGAHYELRSLRSFCEMISNRPREQRSDGVIALGARGPERLAGARFFAGIEQTGCVKRCALWRPLAKRPSRLEKSAGFALPRRSGRFPAQGIETALGSTSTRYRPPSQRTIPRTGDWLAAGAGVALGLARRGGSRRGGGVGDGQRRGAICAKEILVAQ